MAGQRRQKPITVQLFGTHDEQQLNQHLKISSSKSIEINGFFVYHAVAKGEPAITVT